MTEPAPDTTQVADQSAVAAVDETLASAQTDEENPYPKLQEGGRSRPDGPPAKRPVSLRADLDSTRPVPRPPLQQPLPDKYLRREQPSPQPEVKAAGPIVYAPAFTAAPEPIAPYPPFAEEKPVSDTTEPSVAATDAQTAPPQPGYETPQTPLQQLIARVEVLRQERPEVLVGAAFAGGLILAAIFKRMAQR